MPHDVRRILRHNLNDINEVEGSILAAFTSSKSTIETPEKCVKSVKN